MATKILQNFLKDYLENLDLDIFNLFSPEIRDAVFKDTIIDKFMPNSPFKLKVGKLGLLVLDGMSTLTCTDLQLLIVPNKGIVYDEEKEKKNAQELKMKALEQIENARLAERGKGESSSGLVDWLINKAMNIKIIFDYVHIRYEDEFSDPESPFSAGIRIRQIKIVNIDASEAKVDAHRMSKKKIEIDDLSVYFNCKSEIVSRFGFKESIVKRMTDLATSSDNAYVIRSWNPTCEFYYINSPEKHQWKVPQTDARASLNNISIKLTKSQYNDMMIMMDSLASLSTFFSCGSSLFQDRFSKAEKYRKHSVILSQKGKKTARRLWKFAYESILCEVVRRRRKEWSWKRMKQHRDLVKSYTESYLDKRTIVSIPKRKEKIIEEAEERLDLWNINLARTRVELEIDKRGLTRVEDQAKATKIVGKIGSIFSSGSNADIAKPLEKEERAKLADSCDRIANVSTFPKDYVDKKMALAVDEMRFTLDDSTFIILSKISASSKMRSGAAAMDFQAALSDISLCANGNEFIKDSSTKNWITAKYTTNPLDGSFDQKAELRIEPITIKFNANTVYELMRFFSPPESILFDQLLSLHIANYNSIISNTLTGLKHAAAKRQRLVLDLEVQPATLLVCEGFVFDDKKLVMSVNCGRFKVGTDNSLDPKLSEEQRTKLLVYNRFALSWTEFKCAIAKNQSDPNSKSLFHPIFTQLQFHMCSIEDQNLASYRVLGSLPDFVLSVDEKSLMDLIRIGLSMPPNKLNSTQERVEKAVRKISLTNLNVKSSEKKEKSPMAFAYERPMFEADLHWDKMGFELVSGSKVVAHFILSKMNTKVTKKMFDAKMTFEIGGIKIGSPQLKILEKAKSSDTLLNLVVDQASPDSPELKTKFNETLMKMDLKFAKVDCNLIQEPLVELSTKLRKVSNRVNALAESLLTEEQKKKAESLITDATTSITEKTSSVIKDNVSEIPSSITLTEMSCQFGGMMMLIGAKKIHETIADIKDIQIDAVMKSDLNKFQVKLQGLNVEDVTIGATHKNVLRTEIGNKNLMFDCSYEQYLKPNKAATEPDSRVTIRVAEIKCVYTALWASRMTLWMAPFSKKLSESAEKILAEVAKPLVADPMKMALDISMKSPVIYVPCSSKSNDGLIINMGSLRVTNQFKSENRVILDVINVELSNIEAFVGALDGSLSSILAKTAVSTRVSRNLTWEKNKTQAMMAANVKISEASVTLSKAQYTILMSIASGNLQEKVENDNETEITANCEETNTAETTAVKSSTPNSTAITMSAEFVADELKVSLIDENQGKFALFECHGLVADHMTFENGTTRSQVKLKSLIAEDSRPTAAVRSIFETRKDQTDNLFDLTCVQCAETGMKLNIIAKPLTVYFNPSFLGNLQKFVAVEKTAEQTDKDKITSTTGSTTVKSASPQASAMIIDVNMKEIELVVLESSTSRSLILSFDVKAHPEKDSTTIAGINYLFMYTADSGDRTKIAYEILKRTNIDLKLSTTSKNINVELDLHTLDIHIAPSIIRLLSSISQTFSDASSREEKPRAPQFPHHPDYWKPMPLKKSDFWFLQPLTDFVEMTPSIVRSEKMEVNLNRLSITVEADDRKVRAPLIQFEAEASGRARNWSSRLESSGEVALQMNYFNEQLGVWEPVIEQCEVIGKPYEPWRMKIKARTTPPNENKPDLSISITAERMMNSTISKTFYELSKKLQESFSNARNLVSLPSSSSWPGTEPLLIHNKTGVPVTIRNSKNLEVVGPEILEPGQYADLRAVTDISDVETAVERKEDRMSALRQTIATHELVLVINGMLSKVIVGNDKRQIVTFNNPKKGLIKAIIKSSVQGGRRLFTLTSLARIKSHLGVDVEVLTQNLQSIGKLKAGGSLHVPVDVLLSSSAFFFRCNGIVSKTSLNWASISTKKDKSKEHRQLIECKSEGGIFRCDAVVKEKKCEPSGVFSIIHLHPPMLLQNLFTVPVKVQTAITINPGQQLAINQHCGESVELMITYFPEKFIGNWKISDEKFTNILFKTGKKEMYFGVHVFRCKNGGLRGVLYAPYWIDNNSQLKLTCKAATTISFAPSDSVGTMFPFSGNNPKSTQKMRISVEKSDFSSKLAMDVVGKQDKFVCREGKRMYELAITIRMCSSGLTRVITISPYYMVSNCGDWDISIREPSSKTWIKVPAKTSIGLYPIEREPRLIVRYSGKKTESISFPISRSIDTFALIDDESAGVSISINITPNSAVIYLTPFSHGAAPLQIINNTALPLHFSQKGIANKNVLAPKKTQMLTWSDLFLPQVIEYASGNVTGEVQPDHSFLKKMRGSDGFVVSFFNGRQSTLLFEESYQRAMRAAGSWESDKISTELRLDMEGISLSLVDNVNRREILLAAVTSSDLIWGKVTTTGGFKQFDEKKARAVEDLYQLYKGGDERHKTAVIDKITYDFSTMTMIKGTEQSRRAMLRAGEKAIQAVMTLCKERTSYSLKLSRVQIDNQLDHSPFPCILSIAAPPLSDIVEFNRKPLFEMNLVLRNQTHSLVPEIERLTTSTHPIALKIDLGVLGELQRFASSEDDDDSAKGYGEDSFKADYQLTELSLEAIAQSWRAMQPKAMYQHLVLGKMDILLAITSGDGLASFDLGMATSVVALLTKFAGVDTVLTMNAIERRNFACSTAQLQADLTSEWLSLDRKIVLGLTSLMAIDAIGNPVQLAREIGKGFEGAAIAMREGMKKRKASRIAFYMWKSARLLAGHTIGGTTGALGKVVQTLGKGASTLTFDQEYQKRRQDEIMRKPKAFLKEVPHVFSVFGRSLLGGITGVVNKPVVAVKERGAAGLPVGIGKGLIGAVIKPVSSTLDLTSTMIHQLRHATSVEWEPESMRPPRRLEEDGILRPFALNDSIGYAIFKETDSGHWLGSDEFIAHGSVKEEELLLITDKRLIFAKLGAIWYSDWTLDYGQIKELVPLQGGVKIITTSSKKFLKGGKGKIVMYNNAEVVNPKLMDAFAKWKNLSQ